MSPDLKARSAPEDVVEAMARGMCFLELRALYNGWTEEKVWESLDWSVKEYWRKHAIAALSAADAAGWVMAPKELTGEMIHAGEQAVGLTDVWRTLLAAAPKAGGSDSGDVRQQQRCSHGPAERKPDARKEIP